MCKILLSNTEYESEELYLNTLILNQRGKPFTEEDIISIVESDGIDSTFVRATLHNLIRKGLVVYSGGKFYVRPISRKRFHRAF